MDEIELKVHDMSSTLQPADAYALVLEEVNGNRKLPIIIGSLEAQAIKVVMMGYKMPRPDARSFSDGDQRVGDCFKESIDI